MRPSLLSVIALMVLLVPFLLLTSSAQKLTGMHLGLPGSSETLPPDPIGPVESLRVRRVESGYQVEMSLRNTDVRASVGDVERREIPAADLAELQRVLNTVKQLDPQRERITLTPAGETTAAEVVALMDAVRSGPQGPLFPRIVMETGP